MKPNWKSRLFQSGFWAGILGTIVTMLQYVVMFGPEMGVPVAWTHYIQLVVMGGSGIVSALGFNVVRLRMQDYRQRQMRAPDALVETIDQSEGENSDA